MCGVLAQIKSIAFDSEEKERFHKALEQLSHRGPDNEGIELLGYKENILLGHRRLSIIDLSKGASQPFSSNDGKLWLTYNGEIYNYIELRDELKDLGHSFTTQSDTEVLLCAYIEWGESFVNRLNGMFSFLLVDLTVGKAYGVRDRFGIKPFYYHQGIDELVFSSEIKGVISLCKKGQSVNKKEAAQFLHSGETNQNKETLFNDIYQLLPGEIMSIDLKNQDYHIKRWYEVKSKKENGNYSSWRDNFYKIFKDSLKIRLRSDVSLGVCLSGGMDSSTIVAQLSQGNGLKLKIFSALYPGTNFDETVYVDALEEECAIESYRVAPHLSQYMQKESLNKILWHQEEPFPTTSIVAQWSVMELAGRNDVKVVLDGQGADEILAGYHRYVVTYFAEMLRSLKIISFFKNLISFKSSLFLKEMGLIKFLIRIFLVLFKIHRHRGAKPYDSIFSDKTIKGNQQYFDNLNKHLEFDIFHGLQALLRFEDRNSMAFSIESRVPFLDYRLLEHCLSAQSDWLYDKGLSKTILRDRLNPIPEKIRKRADKIGFMSPGDQWVIDNKPQLSDDVLKASVSGIYSGVLENNLLMSYFKNNHVDNSFLFRLWIFARWHQVFFKSNS